MIVLKRLLALLVCLVLQFQIFAQDDFFKGYLYDVNERVPIPFATIQVKGWSKGVISNKNGSFRIPAQFKQLSDTLLISCMGYESKKISFSKFKEDDSNVIFLNPGVFLLDETVLKAKKKRSLSGAQIVRRAIRKIYENYPKNDFSLVGYYRDYQWHDENYLNLNESLVEIFDHGFGKSDEWRTNYALYSVNKNNSFPRDSASARPYDYDGYTKVINKAYLEEHGGNELLILRVHDAIRNFDVNSYSFVHNMREDFVLNHTFTKKKDTYFENEALYHVSFHEDFKAYSAFGSLLISKRNFAIYKMDYALYNNLKKSEDGKESRHGTDRELLFEVTTEYRPVGNKMYLNYITFDNSFLLPLPPRFYVDDFSVQINLKRLELTFNTAYDLESATNLKNYKFIYKGEKLDIMQIIPNPLNDRQLYIYPKFKHNVARNSFFDFFENLNSRMRESVAKRFFKYELKNIFDVDGNEINEVYDYEKYLQYREFFTQEVRPNTRPAHGLPKMKKDIPVFSEYQRIVPKKDIDYFWMNTPLKGQSFYSSHQPNLLVTRNR